MSCVSREERPTSPWRRRSAANADRKEAPADVAGASLFITRTLEDVYDSTGRGWESSVCARPLAWVFGVTWVNGSGRGRGEGPVCGNRTL